MGLIGLVVRGKKGIKHDKHMYILLSTIVYRFRGCPDRLVGGPTPRRNKVKFEFLFRGIIFARLVLLMLNATFMSMVRCAKPNVEELTFGTFFWGRPLEMMMIIFRGACG